MMDDETKRKILQRIDECISLEAIYYEFREVPLLELIAVADSWNPKRVIDVSLWVIDEDGVIVGVRCRKCSRVVVAVADGLCIDCQEADLPCAS